MIEMLLLHVNIVHCQVQKSKQKHVTERYSRLHNHSTLLCFSQTRETLKLKMLPSQLRYSLPSIIIMITSNKPWNTEMHKTYWNPPITDHKPWPFEPIIWTSHKKTIKMIRLHVSGCLLEVAPCENRTTRVLFIKEVQTHLGANHFTSEGPRGSRGGEGWVNCCRHEFFFNPFICREFFLEVCICLIFSCPSNTLHDFFCVWMGLKK